MEGGPSGTFTVTRVGGDSAELTVLYSVGGTATQGSDYVALGASVTIAADEAGAIIQVDPMDDLTAENDETVVVTLLPDPAYDVATLAAATVTILSEDIPIDIVIDIEPSSDSNTINLNKKKGRKSKISVAILSAQGFDATTVDASTVLFGPDGADGAPPPVKRESRISTATETAT